MNIFLEQNKIISFPSNGNVRDKTRIQSRQKKMFREHKNISMLYLYIKNDDLSKIGNSKYFSASNALRLFSSVRYLNATVTYQTTVNWACFLFPHITRSQNWTSALILPAKSQLFCIYTLNLFFEKLFTLSIVSLKNRNCTI